MSNIIVQFVATIVYNKVFEFWVQTRVQMTKWEDLGEMCRRFQKKDKDRLLGSPREKKKKNLIRSGCQKKASSQPTKGQKTILANK